MTQRAQSEIKGTGNIDTALSLLRVRARRMLLLQRGSALLAAVLAMGLTVGFADYAARLPSAVRWIFLIAILAGLVYGMRRWIFPAWRFRPSLTEIALRLESSGLPGADRARGLLASAVELQQERSAEPATQWMERQVIDRAAVAIADIAPQQLVSRRAAGKNGGAALAALVIVAAMFALKPTLTAIGAQRVLAPWSDAAWPKRTAVADATRSSVHALGSALPLRAVLTRSDRSPEQTTVAARYRLVIDGLAGPTQRVVLTSQGRREQVASGDSGDLYERLLEPGLLAAVAQNVERAQVEYWFETVDNETSTKTIELIEPPLVESARGSITPPAYAQAAIASGAPFLAGELELGAGSDSRAVVGPILRGSGVDITIELNKSVPGPATPADRTAWARRMLGDESLSPWISAWGDEGYIALSLTLDQTRRFPVVVQDEYGITSAEESVYTFEAVEDAAATVAVTDPPEDEAVLATAQIGLVGEGRDDAGVSWISLESVVAKPPPGSIGAPASAIGTANQIAYEAFDQAPLQAQVMTVLDLSTLGLVAGDEVRISALAGDTFEIDGQLHEPGRSSIRTLRIISEDDLAEQIRRGLAGVRASAIRLHTQQERVSEQTQQDGATEENRAVQAGLTEQLRAQRDAIERLASRAGRNNLSDRTLSELLEEATEALTRASQRSNDAESSMTTGRPSPELTEEESELVEEAQVEVADELEQLIEMLDRGEDSWLSRRSLERLLEEQRSLMAQTEAAAAQTIGRNVDELTENERSLLEEIARKQSDLAEQAENAMDDLRDRSEQMQEVDPAQAEAMSQAAQHGQRSQVQRTLEEAAQNIEQNRTQQGQQQQQEAAQALEEMLEELDDADRNRDQALRRVLASAIESIQSLITQQEGELGAFQNAEQLSGLDVGMIRLHQNTLGVIGEIQTSFRELAPVATILIEAADAQTTAITAIRESDRDTTEESEMESLDALNRALAEAERLDEEAAQREQDRRLEELRSAYRDLLEQQVALRAETRPFVEKTLTRRQRSQVRGLGGRQETLRDTIAAIPEQYEEFSEAAVFDFAHRRLDEATSSAAQSLQGGTVNSGVIRRQDSAVRLLRSLVEALEDLEQEQSDEFRDGGDQSGEGGESGEQGEQPLIPPIKELLLLRAMQQEAADYTKAVNDDSSALPEEVNDLATMQRELEQQATDLINRLQQQQPGSGDDGGDLR